MSLVALVGVMALAAACLRRAVQDRTLLDAGAWAIGGGTWCALTGLIASLLALFSALSADTLGVGCTLVAAPWWPWRAAGLASATHLRWTSWIAGLIIVAGMGLRAPPIEFPMGGRDQGSYLLRAQHTARTGAIDATDEMVAAAAQRPDRTGSADILGLYERRHAPWREDRYEAAYRPGWYLADFESGHVVPQFFHLQPCLLAAGELAFGPGRAIWWIPIEAAIALLGLWAVGRRFFPPVIALGVLALYATSPIAIWTQRQALSEPLVAALLLAAAAALTRDERPEVSAAAFLIGTLAWVRGDGWLIAAVAMAWVWTGPLRGSRRLGPAAVTGALLVAGIAVHAHTSFPYVHDEITRQLGSGATLGAWRLTGLAVIGAGVWWAMDAMLRGRAATMWILARGPAFAVGVAAIGVAMHLALRDGAGHARLEPAPVLLGWPLLVLAGAGALLFARHRVRPTPAHAWALGLAATVGLTVVLYAPPNLPHAGLYYYGRYLVPVLLPAAILLGGLTASVSWRLGAVGKLLALGALVGAAWPARVLITHPQTRLHEFEGAAQATQRLAAAIPDDAIVIAGGEGWHHGHTFNQIGAALAFGAGRTVAPFRTDEATFGTLWEVLVAQPRHTGESPPPVYLLVNEATHARRLVGTDRPLSAVDLGLIPPFFARTVRLYEMFLYRLTPVTGELPTRVTRDALRMALIEVAVDPDSGVQTWDLADRCLDPLAPVDFQVPDGPDGRALVITATPGTAADNHGWSLTLDGAAVPLDMPRHSPRARDTLGPLVMSAGPHELAIRGPSVARSEATCPHGGVHEIRVHGPPRSNVPLQATAATWTPPDDLGHPVVGAAWVPGRGLSRYRPLQTPAPSVAAVSLVLAPGRSARFGRVALPGAGAAPIDFSVTLTLARVSPDARVAIKIDGVVLDHIDPPDDRGATWQSPALRFVPTSATAEIEVELVGTSHADERVRLRDVSMFVVAPPVMSEKVSADR